MAVVQYTPNSQGGVTVAYDAATRHYLVTTPADTTPAPLQRDPSYTPQPGDPWRNFVLPYGFYFLIRASAEDPDPQFRYTYSNLVAWGYRGSGGFRGISAFGIPTPASAVPRIGAGTFAGFLEGSSTETYRDGLADGPLNAGLSGSVNLTFDFAAAKLSGVIAPNLELGPSYALGPLQLTNADWAVGSPTFAAQLAGGSVVASGLQGRFTGPAAEELIGRFSFGYTSPIDALAQTAGGTFIAKRSSGQ